MVKLFAEKKVKPGLHLKERSKVKWLKKAEMIDVLLDTRAAKAVGEAIAKRALAKGIEEVTFDRGGFLYHGRVKELADGAREAGLKF